MKKLFVQLTRFFLTISVMAGFFLPSGFCTSIADIIGHGSDPKTFRDSDDTFYAIQFGYFLDQEKADEQVLDLKKRGFDPYIFQSINAKGQTVYSVRMGRFPDHQTAAEKIQDLTREVNTPLLITYYDSLDPAEEIMPSPLPKKSVEKIEYASEGEESETSSSSGIFSKSGPEVDVSPEELNIESLNEKVQSLQLKIEKLTEEAEARRKLSITEEEKTEETEDILEAAGGEYTLTRAGNIKFNYGFGYSYSEYDAIREAARVEDVSNHTIRNSFGVSYGVKDNITVSTSIPFIYKYHKVGTVDSLDVNDFGDLSLNWQLQPIKSTADLPTIILNGGFTVPVGRSPYEIQPGKELSTSSGFYSTSLGVSASQVSDPVVVFSSFGATYSFEVTDINQKRAEGTLEEVDPGIGLGVSAGLGYALSYKLNLNLSFGYSYSFETKYHYQNGGTAETGTGTAANMNLGVGYRLKPGQNLNFSIGIPITETRQFSFSLSLPVEFEL